MHYLDNAATTQVAPEVVQTVAATLENHFANPSSLYLPGYEAEQVISASREVLAKALGCAAAQVTFTASGTEGANIAIYGLARARKNWGGHLVATGYEHPCITGPLGKLAQEEGFTVTWVNPTPDGVVSEEAILAAVGGKTALVCAMQVNNETGAVIDVQKLAAAVKQKNLRTAVLVDGSQGFTKLPLALANTAIDAYIITGHKLHAPKGVGALYLRKGVHFLPPFAGGGQEQGVHPGTENTAYIAGLAKAVQLALQNAPQRRAVVAALHRQLLHGLATLPGVCLNSPQNGYKGIVNFSLPGLRSETLLHFLAEKRVYVSSGSACSKGQASHTLAAMGLPPARTDSALRVSFCQSNTAQDVTALLNGLQAAQATLARARQPILK